jgi:membrane-associated phospholipid phosphatase
MRPSVRSPLLAAAACFLGFVVVLVCAYAIAPVGRLDAIALGGLMTLDGQPFYSLAVNVVHTADPLPLMVMLAGLVACGWVLGRRREALAAVALVAGANLTGLILQAALAHPRFHPILGADQVGPAAYPSGHATTAMSIALAAVLVAPPRLRVAVAAGAAAYGIAVSISLVVLGWHFASDVLGGMLLSSGFFFLALALTRVAPGRRAGVAARRVRLALSPGLGAAAAAGLVAAGLIALSRADELLAFARLHTVATVTALAVMAVSAGLVASATLISDP